MGPSESRPGRLPVICSLQTLSSAAPAADGTGSGLPGSVIDLSTPAVLSYPGESIRCIRSLLRGQCWLRRIRPVGHSHWRNEAHVRFTCVTADVFVLSRLRRLIA